MKQTPMQELEKWIFNYEKTNGTPTMCEIKAQIEMFKEKEKQVIIDAFLDGYCNDENNPTSSEDYYNETFKQK
jgi:hypothetical protein